MQILEKIKSEGRFVDSALMSNLVQNGAREGDEFILDIFQERKKTFKLNRTRYQIMFGEKFHFDFIKSIIVLPAFNHRSEKYELLLIKNNESDDDRYLLRSGDNYPFRLNGQFVFESFIERGDCIELGFNKIFFPKEKKKITSDLEISPKIMESKISILIEGETGTGKTTLAKKIHEESQRTGPLVHLNLSSFSQSLIESELFGHVKGAFTGAINQKRGALLEANRGTLFIDEIDSLSLENQTKLLLFLDNQMVRSVGSEVDIKTDVRLIFASGSSLKDRVKQGLMRKDFYHRVRSGYFIKLKSLRENQELIKDVCLDFEHQNAICIDLKLIEFYQTCHWSGNYRELIGHLKKKKICSDSKRLVLDELDYELIADSQEEVLRETHYTLDELKYDYCYRIYLKHERSLSKTAKVLEISMNTLKSYLEKKEKGLRNQNIVQVDF